MMKSWNSTYRFRILAPSGAGDGSQGFQPLVRRGRWRPTLHQALKCLATIYRPFGTKTVAAVALALLFAGCTVGPDYVAPQESVAESWSTEPAEGLTPEAEVLAEWWTALDDPLLDNLIERAAGANHDLRVAAARVREARARYRIARSRGLPSLGVEAAYTRSGLSEEGVGLGPFAVEQGLIDREEDFYEAGFDASWELDVFGGVRRSRQAATARAEAAEEDRRDVLRTVLAEVARGYLELRGAQRRLTVARDNLRIQQQSLELVESKVKTGLARPLELEQARAQLESTRSAIPAFQAQVRAGAHRLGVLVGDDPGALIEQLETARAVPATSRVFEVFRTLNNRRLDRRDGYPTGV